MSMEIDRISRSSLDSTSTAGDEYVVVNPEPRLRIANNGDMSELEERMSEFLAPADGGGGEVTLAINGEPIEPSSAAASRQPSTQPPPKCMILNSQSMEKITADILNADNTKAYDPRYAAGSKARIDMITSPVTSPTGRVVKNPFDEKGKTLMSEMSP